METVLYNGVNLTLGYTVVGIRRPLPTPTPNMELVPGGNRNFVRGVDLVPPTFGFTIVATGLDEAGKRAAVRDLASKLLVEEAVPVQFSGDSGKYYMAVPSGELNFQEFIRSGRMEVTLTAVEAAMRGASRSASSSGGTAQVVVGGNYRTVLSITAASAVRQSSSNYMWGVTAGGKLAQVEIGTSSAVRVVIDGEKRAVSVAGANAQMTLQSDWLELEPGAYTVTRQYGTGEFAVSWVERWL